MENTPLHLQELNSNQNMHIICSESRTHHSRQYFHLVNSFLSHNISAEIVHLSYCNSISCIGLHPFIPWPYAILPGLISHKSLTQSCELVLLLQFTRQLSHD